jgi:hypothetical protein
MLLLLAGLVALAACGGGNAASSSSNSQTAVQAGTVNMVLSDASTEDWALIGVKVLSVSLTPQGGGTPVTIYTAPSPAPSINLVQLDQLGEIIGNAQVAPGTYTSATLTISANPGDVLLTTAADPQTGFDGGSSQSIPASQIQIQGTTGSSGSKTVSVPVKLVSNLVVTANQSNALDLEFDLSHPAFIVEHNAAAGVIWSVNFNGPVRHHPIYDLTRLILRHLYAQVGSVSSDNSTITVTRQFPTEPPVSPETAVASSYTLPILADSTNGTIYYDVDAKAAGVAIKDFSSIASTLPTKYVRIAARYQANGTLVAVRIWASSSFNSVWISPEGHVLHVDSTNDVITIQNELGKGVKVTVGNSTEFFFRTPWNTLSDATPIATGTQFLTDNDLVRGFKVHVSLVDPLASTLTAQTVDIEIAKYDGTISSATTTGFDYTRNFATATDDYTNKALDYISSTTANGNDPNTGAAITGFKWWNFTYPTVLQDGANATSSFMSATNGSANFNGTVGSEPAWGVSYSTWNDPASSNNWSALWSVLEPTPLPLGTAGAWASGANSGSFGLTVPGGANSVPVTASTVSGSAPVVYQVDRTKGVVTVSLQDITTSAGLSTFTTALATLPPVKVYGIPQSDGTIKSYVIFYYTGDSLPTD